MPYIKHSYVWCVGKVLEQVLETGGDFRMLFSIKEMYPDPNVPIVKAVNTKDPSHLRKVCTIWNSRYSIDGYILSFQSSFTFGLETLVADEETMILYDILRTKPVEPKEKESDSESGEEESSEESEDENPNPYLRPTLEERLEMITSGKVTDVNNVVCEFTRMCCPLARELRTFIEVNGIQHMSKIQGVISLREPEEDIIWLMDTCIGLGYTGRKISCVYSYIKHGVIYYSYPSIFNSDIACWMYFEGSH